VRGTSGPEARARSTMTPPRRSVRERHGCRSESGTRAFARPTMTPLSSAPGQTRGFDRRRESAPQTTARALFPANRPYAVTIIWRRSSCLNAIHVRNRPSRFTGTERSDVPRKAPRRTGAETCTTKISNQQEHWDRRRSDRVGRTPKWPSSRRARNNVVHRKDDDPTPENAPNGDPDPDSRVRHVQSPPMRPERNQPKKLPRVAEARCRPRLPATFSSPKVP
jgi:hypothetical protein